MPPTRLVTGLLALTATLVAGCDDFAPSSNAIKRSLRVRTSNATSPYFDDVSDYIESASDELWKINKAIHENPELGYEEYEAHDLLTSFMEDLDGWNVTRSVGGIETAFMAVFEGDGDGPVVSFNAEYDALPEIGHACGHNLIATVSVGGALATAKIMKDEGLGGKVILFGTPAEESLGGKIKMLDADVFHDAKIDISLISHPMAADDSPYMIVSATDRFDVEYYGKESHAAGAPYEGVNAQDALLIANNAMAFMRQQMRPSDRVHGIINSAGTRINIIPALSSASYQVRANTEGELKNLTQRVKKNFEAGELATGAELNFTMRPNSYSDLISNDLLAESYSEWFQALGGELPDPVVDKMRDPSGSTDQGNVSKDFPSISPMFKITNEDGSAPEGGPHTKPFQVAAGSKPAFEKALMVAKSLAGVAVDVLTVDGLLDKIKEEFKESTEAADSS